MFVDINMFWAQLRLTLAWAIRQGLKWALRMVQNIFMPKNLNCITTVISLEGTEKLKAEKKKMIKKQSEEYCISFTNTLRKWQQTL